MSKPKTMGCPFERPDMCFHCPFDECRGGSGLRLTPKETLYRKAAYTAQERKHHHRKTGKK